MKKMRREIYETHRTTQRFNKGFRAAIGTLKQVAVITAAAIGFRELGQGIASAVREAANLQRSQNIIQNTIRITGGSAGVAADEVDRFAESLFQLRGGDINEIYQASNVMLTIAENSKLAGDNIFRIVQLASDLAVAFDDTLIEATKEIGELGVNPYEVVTTIEKYGDFFDERERQHLKFLQDSNREIEAADIVLTRLENRFRGATAAAAAGLSGAQTGLQAQTQLFQSELGDAISTIVGWETILRQSTEALKLFTGVIEDFNERDAERNAEFEAARKTPGQQLREPGVEGYPSFRDQALDLLHQQALVQEELHARIIFVDSNNKIIDPRKVIIPLSTMEAYRQEMNFTPEGEKFMDEAIRIRKRLIELFSGEENIPDFRGYPDTRSGFMKWLNSLATSGMPMFSPERFTSDDSLLDMLIGSGAGVNDATKWTPSQQERIDELLYAALEDAFISRQRRNRTGRGGTVDEDGFSTRLNRNTRLDDPGGHKQRRDLRLKAFNEAQAALTEIGRKNATEERKERQRIQELIDETLKSTKDELVFEQELGKYRVEGKEKELFLAERLYDLQVRTNWTAGEYLEEYKTMLSELWDLQNAVNNDAAFRERWAEGAAEISGSLTDIGRSLADYASNGEDFWDQFRDAGIDAAWDIAQTISNKALWDPLQDTLTEIFDNAINALADGINDAISLEGSSVGAPLFENYKFTGGSGGPLFSPRAQGGPVTAGVPYMTGERGREIFVPNSNGYVFNNADTNKMLGSSAVSINFSPVINSGNKAEIMAELQAQWPAMLDMAEERIANSASKPGQVRSAFGG